MEFKPFPKLARLNRGMVVTEKIDGTNAAVVIEETNERFPELTGSAAPLGLFTTNHPLGTTGKGNYLAVYAQSRKHVITPGSDNFGFAAWVKDHAHELVALGPGYHYGEWWGLGIQRGYDLDEKRFSLFNTGRWIEAKSTVQGASQEKAPQCCHVVPVLATANFDQQTINDTLDVLRVQGSAAAPGFMRPEGVVVYLSAARTSFKVTLEKDGVPKSLAEAA